MSLRPNRRRAWATTVWLVTPRGLSTTATPESACVFIRLCSKPDAAALLETGFEHALNGGAHALGEPPDQQIVVGGFGTVVIERNGLAELDAPFGGRRH